jgi:hypothetical protein
MKEHDSVTISRDLPELGLTAGWPGCLLLDPRDDRDTLVVEFFWGTDWLESDVFDVPKDAVVASPDCGNIFDQPKRSEPRPWKVAEA